MFSPATVQTRLSKPLHRPWIDEATNGQLEAVGFLANSASGLLVADRGAGKTAITLMAFKSLQDAGVAKRMLIIAPLRVCQLVWRQEAKKWTEFRDLRFSFLHGDKKDDRLRDDADIWLINPEGVEWLCKKYWGRSLPWDTVTFDQIIKFKNSQGVRAKALRKRLGSLVRRRWGLEGAIAPNGYEDLFGEMLMLDEGAALGRYVTHFRTNYFQPAFDGSLELQPGAARRIEQRIAPYCYRLAYTELPPLQDEVIEIELAPAERAKYEQLKKKMILQLGATTITAANSAVVYGKLKQLANGAIYTGNEKEWIQVHDQKLDALKELIDELRGAPLLIAYEYRHDLERMMKAIPGLRTFDGLNGKDAEKLQDDWNANKVPYIAAHPASIGHGLNLQQGGARHIAWFTPTIDLNLYEEFIGRLRRRGNEAESVINHLFIAKNTVDETLTLPAIRDKECTQNTLLARLAEMCGVPATGSPVVVRSNSNGADMNTTQVTKLSRQGNGTAPPAALGQGANNGASPFRPAGWKQPAPVQETAQDAPPKPNPFVRPGAATPNAGAQIEQRKAVEAKITGQPAPMQTEQYQEEPQPATHDATRHFSAGVQEQLQAPAGEADQMAQEVDNAADGKDAKPRRTRTRKADVETVAFDVPQFDPAEQKREQQRFIRTRAIEMALDYGVKLGGEVDVIGIAQSIVDFVNVEG